MKKGTFLLGVLFQLLIFTACSSVDGDAKKAAELNKKSIDYVMDENLEKAAEAYQESQEIVARYKGTDKYEEFYTAYSKYLLDEMPGN